MFPIVCQIGPVTVYSYGVMMAVAVMVCTFFLSRDARLLGISSEKIFDFVFWIVLSGIVGARLFFILLNFDYFVNSPWEVIMVQKGGLAWQGSLIAGTAAALIYMKRQRLPPAAFVDIAAPYIALGQAIGRVGCFFNGCCYGKVLPWGIYFPVHQAHLHPTQLYDAMGLLLIFFVLKKYQRLNKISGRVFILYLILASLQRFIIEFFRADHSIALFGLSIFQLVCIAVFLAALYANTRLKS